jgi:hypothetical protein
MARLTNPDLAHPPGREERIAEVQRGPRSADRSEDRDIVITHVWFEATPRVFALPPARPLPVRLKPYETWETWLELEAIPSTIQDNLFGMARVRLSTGQVISSVENVGVPERGFVPGGPINTVDDK